MSKMPERRGPREEALSTRGRGCSPPGEYAGNEDRWELDCDVRGYLGSGAPEAEAEEMAFRHAVGPAWPASTSSANFGSALDGWMIVGPSDAGTRPRGESRAACSLSLRMALELLTCSSVMGTCRTIRRPLVFGRRDNRSTRDDDQPCVTPLSLATEWRTEAAFIGRGHYKAADRAAKWHRRLGIATAAASAGVGTSLLTTLEGLGSAADRVISPRHATVLGVLALVTGGAVAIQAYLRYDDVSQQHRGAGAAYEVLGRELDVLIAENEQADMERLKALRQRMNELDKTTPLIPRRAYHDGRREIVNCKGHLEGRGRPRGVVVHHPEEHARRCQQTT